MIKIFKIGWAIIRLLATVIAVICQALAILCGLFVADDGYRSRHYYQRARRY